MGTDAIEGDIVVLAVPYGALTDVVTTYGEKLNGKIVVDITNPVDLSTFSPIPVDAGSAAQELQAALPGAQVVKAFNTNFAATLASGQVGEAQVNVLVAADDEAAKKAVIDLAEAAGAKGVDAGPLAGAWAPGRPGLPPDVSRGLGADPRTGGFTLIS